LNIQKKEKDHSIKKEKKRKEKKRKYKNKVMHLEGETQTK
jgi:hypothetical protein